MTRFCTILLLITLLFPPVTVASISMVCSMSDMETAPMSHPMEHASEEPMDASHACCPMPEPEAACDVAFVAAAYTCCDDVQISRDQEQPRMLPISRYNASDISQAALVVSTDLSVDVLSIPRIVSAHTLSFLENPSPPLQSLLCTYII